MFGKFGKAKQVALVVAAATAAVFGASTQASAVVTYTNSGSCTGATLCVYEHNNFQGYTSVQVGDHPFVYTGYMDNRASSIVNQSSQIYCFYDGANYDGAHLQVGFGKLYPDLGSIGFADKISSYCPGKC
ncbi:peptidase inhibitor family I36 protein [Streptomyces griseoluteus]|uniref:peptidase inhibitor family I36 protein n=1 Tax=Streptomyces griseoluteus TaxID=29306 RepID=UPI0037F6D203